MTTRAITVDPDDWKEFKRIVDDGDMSKTIRSMIRRFIAESKENDPSLDSRINEQEQGNETLGETPNRHGESAPTIASLRNLDNEPDTQSSHDDNGKDREDDPEIIEDDDDSFWKPEFTYE